MTVVGLALGLLVGVTLGLLGGGGSILTVPIFVMVMGIETKSAIAMSLAVVGTTSLVGAWRHWRESNIDIRTALTFGAFAMVGSFVGARASHLISGDIQMTIFGAAMLAAAVFMYGQRNRVEDLAGKAPRPNIRLIVFPAAATGLLTGLIGVGGGFLIVPALVLLAGVPMKRAVGTSLLVIAMTAATGFAGQLMGGVEIRWAFMALFTGIAIVGIIAGSALVPRVETAALKRGFALFLVLMALLILYQNRSVYLGS